MRIDTQSNPKLFKALCDIWKNRGIAVDKYIVWAESCYLSNGEFVYKPVIKHEKFGQKKFFGSYPEYKLVNVNWIYSHQLISYIIAKLDI